MLLWPPLALAQPADQGLPAQEQLNASRTFGALAAVSPLCGLRDMAWAADLWRAELQATAGSARAGETDPARQRLADRAGAALSYGEDEALEAFAEAPPEVTCGPLVHDPNLKRADDLVAAFREGTNRPVW